MFTNDIKDFSLGEDNLVMGDLLGTSSQESMDHLLSGGQWNNSDSSLTVNAGYGLSMQALFETNGVTLNIMGEGETLVQTISVDLTSGDYSYSEINEEVARAVLMEMIKNNV
jgi:hypothetical protein